MSTKTQKPIGSLLRDAVESLHPAHPVYGQRKEELAAARQMGVLQRVS